MKLYAIVIAVFMFLIAIIILTSCGTQQRCYPSKKSRDYATRVWMTQQSDGYWRVYVTRGMMPTKMFLFECRPDTVNVDSLFLKNRI